MIKSKVDFESLDCLWREEVFIADNLYFLFLKVLFVCFSVLLLFCSFVCLLYFVTFCML